jgi:hypothetical protein
MALARCILSKFLGVVCHCFPLNGKYQLKIVKLLFIQNKNCRSNAKTGTRKFKTTYNKRGKLETLLLFSLALKPSAGYGLIVHEVS